ncbi:hypothetical protein [Nafulsella turpanensis]|uniref:hypothetical protein n=1 Tax=Nafulsella turpanensis TaxID=1265690 RepID=UPI00034B19FF|nr:hypothetical protein [Nafulsella turpanensis]
MSFQDKVKITYKAAVVINFITFLFTSAIGLDYLLPSIISMEVITGEERRVDYVQPSRFNPTGEVPSEDTDYLITENFRFQVGRFQSFAMLTGDTVKVYQGRLSRLVMEARLVKNGIERRIERDSTMFGNLAFIPIVTFLTSLVGVLFYKKTKLSIEVGAMSLLLVMIIIFLLK